MPNLPSKKSGLIPQVSFTRSQAITAEGPQACPASLYRGDWKQPEKFPAWIKIIWPLAWNKSALVSVL
jgi:hypothetical protein